VPGRLITLPDLTSLFTLIVVLLWRNWMISYHKSNITSEESYSVFKRYKLLIDIADSLNIK
jgi:hypothetical protein